MTAWERTHIMALGRRALLGRTTDLAKLSLAAAVLGPAAVACGPAQSGGPASGTSQSTGNTNQPAAGGQPVKGGTYTVGNFADAATLQPLLAQDTASSAFIDNHYYAPLLTRNPDTLDYETKYGTAESYQVSPDSLTITFKLKSNIFWSDGQPITAQDYKFTWDKKLDPKVDYPYKSNLRYFESLDAPDDKTLVFKLKEPYCPAIDQTIQSSVIPKHIFENLDVNDNPLNQKPTVGSGPWLLQEWVKDDHATFVANEKYFLGRPNLDKYVFRIVKDATVAYSMLKSGEVDRAGIQAIDWDEAKSLKTINTYNYYPPNASWDYVGYNVRTEALKDVRVRQAFAYALDRKTMVDRIKLGHARPLNSFLAPASWAYTDNVQKYDYNVAKAKQLLDEAGWKAPANDANGTRVKDGKPLKMRIFYNAGNNDREKIATIAQQALKAVGADLEVIAEEWNAYLNRVNKTFDMELYVLGWSAAIDPATSQNIYTTTGGQNSMGYSNPAVDEAFPKANNYPGCAQADRAKVYAVIQQELAKDPPYIFLWENENLSGVSNRIVVNKMSKLGYGYRPWEWYSTTGK
jgi:peptide/nickel transport system substrate-binding protein